MQKIVSVCRGNIARSAVAEEFIRKELINRGLVDQYQSISRGIQGTSVDPQPVLHPNMTYYHPMHEDSRPTLEKLGVDVSTHVSRPMDSTVATQASIMLAMDRKTRDALYALFPEEVGKVHLLSELVGKDKDIIDPEGVSGQERQKHIFTEIRNIIVNGFPRLLDMLAEAATDGA